MRDGADPPELRGSLDAADPDGRVYGWCWSPDEPALRRAVALLLDGREAASGIADLLREDLHGAGIGDGGHAFILDIPLAVRVAGQAAVLALKDVATGRVLGERAISWPAAEAATVAPLAGHIDTLTRDGWVSGWCWDPEEPGRRLTLDVMVDDVRAGTVTAAESRPDLRHAGVGDGLYGFNFMLPYDVLAERGTVRVAVLERESRRLLGEAMLVRIGRRAEAESRLQELERQVILMRGRLEEMTRQAAARPVAEEQASRALFATIAAFFRDLAEGAPLEPRGGVGTALRDLRVALRPFSLRPATLRNGRPLATVAVAATGSVAAVHACLLALHEAGTDLLADIVLLDPSGADPTVALLPALVGNLRVAPLAQGPAAALARLVAEADTDLVALVTPDVRPSPGWLETLAATLAERKDAAIVGAAAIRADGLRHHAGFVLDSAARFRDLGHLAGRADPQHRFLRPVDAVGPFALAFDRARAIAAGGLDPGYGALLPVVADLCLRLRAAGHAVLLQPQAEAIWLGGDADDPTPDTRPLTEDGIALRLTLARFSRTAEFAGHALVIDAQLPVPERDGGSVVALEQMKVLLSLGWRVTFAAGGGEDGTEPDRRRLERVGIEVADRAAYPSVADYLRAHGGSLDLVLLHRYRIAALLLPAVRDLAPRARAVFLPADLHHLREQREAALAGNAADTDAIAATRRQELACIRQADATILFSDHEIDLLCGEVDPARLHLLRWITRPRASTPPFAAREGLLFVGNFRHVPNVDAAIWMAREVMPLLRDMRPGLALDLVGAGAPPSVRALEGDGVRLLGWVADLDSLLDRTRLTVAPLRYGAGFKGKVATSLAAGVPVVGTAIAFEGTGLADGDGVALADDAATFARAVLRVHDDEAVWTSLSERARERVAALYSPEAAAEMFRALLADLGLHAAR